MSFHYIIPWIFLGTLIISYSSADVQEPFWKNSIVYQVYPRSFKDSDGDGIGDLQGIRSKVSHLKDLGVEIVWLSPIYESPMADFGYDISNYTNIDTIFGSMEDFETLVLDLHANDLKLVLDFVPNHTSDEHDWFLRSMQNDTEFEDFYIWADAKGYTAAGVPIPPNNWLSEFRYSAWEWVEERQQFYYHSYLKKQPDLNFRNPAVVQESKEVLRFWLDHGVDGFRVDAVRHLFEVEDIYESDEPVRENSGIDDPTQHNYLDNVYTIGLEENFELVRQWREVVDEYPDKVFMIEDSEKNLTITMKYYGSTTDPIGDFPFNFVFIHKIHNRQELTGNKLHEVVRLWMENMPAGKWPTWVLGNHDQKRIASTMGSDMVDALNMFLMLLPGTPVTYYGEEIGMEDTLVSYEEGQDPSGCNQGKEGYAHKTRDFERTPMHWDGSTMSGFTNGNSSWLPINANYITVNVEEQKRANQSHLKVYKSLSSLRKQKTFQKGSLDIPYVSEHIFSFIRELQGEPSYLIIINTSKFNKTININNHHDHDDHEHKKHEYEHEYNEHKEQEHARHEHEE